MKLTDAAFSGLPKGNIKLNHSSEKLKLKQSEISSISYDAAPRGIQDILQKFL
jgi:hypothetical protein